MNNELKDALIAFATFRLWLDGEIDHNVAVPMLFNLKKLEYFQSLNYSVSFLEAFEEAVEYETIRSLMSDTIADETAERIISGFQLSIRNCIDEGYDIDN
ncbi:MAG: hypothetical protein IJX58_07960 [Clostridia bacterium]|nr:hypothetical protein [Clostridia bacterium]